MRRVLLIATTTGYQTRAFSAAAGRLGVELLLATDRCHQLADPWRDAALPVRFHDEPAFLRAVRDAHANRSIDGVLAVGDRPAIFAALACEALGLAGHPAAAARASGNKLETRRLFAAAGLPCPAFRALPLEDGSSSRRPPPLFPCVVKPLSLSGSRGVIRADNPRELEAAIRRVRRLLSGSDVRALRDGADTAVLVETFIPGREYAVEGLVDRGRLQVLAIFDKPDPLDGPFFEESIYVTPPAASGSAERRIVRAVEDAARALGLEHGPVHAECRVNVDGVFVLEAAARPIGGLCARALRFQGPDGPEVSLEELLLRQALGEPTDRYRREPDASAVMMIPIPGEGRYRRTEHLASARAVPGIVDVVMTAKPGQRLEPLPEGASYPGFIFARTAGPDEAVTALRAAHAQLQIVVDRSLATVQEPAPP